MDPIPETERNMVNMPGPRWKMSLANTGRKVIMGTPSAVMQNASTMRATMALWPRMKPMPCFMPARIFVAHVAGGGNGESAHDGAAAGDREEQGEHAGPLVENIFGENRQEGHHGHAQSRHAKCQHHEGHHGAGIL